MRIGRRPMVVVGCGSMVCGTPHYACSDDNYSVIRCAVGGRVECCLDAFWNLSGYEGRKARSNYCVEQELTRCAVETGNPGCERNAGDGARQYSCAQVSKLLNGARYRYRNHHCYCNRLDSDRPADKYNQFC